MPYVLCPKTLPWSCISLYQSDRSPSPTSECNSIGSELQCRLTCRPDTLMKIFTHRTQKCRHNWKHNLLHSALDSFYFRYKEHFDILLQSSKFWYTSTWLHVTNKTKSLFSHPIKNKFTDQGYLKKSVTKYDERYIKGRQGCCSLVQKWWWLVVMTCRILLICWTII